MNKKKEQIADFLLGRRIIKSIADLPQFIYLNLAKISENNPTAYFAIKGSGAKIRRDGDIRNPVDLDLEIIINGISNQTSENLEQLIGSFIPNYRNMEQNFIDSSSLFSLNIKDDELGLDLSIYDACKIPDPNKSWSTSEDSKIIFNSQGDISFLRYKEKEFYINPEARDLTFRICFAKTTNPNNITTSKICLALEAISPKNPIDLFFAEFLHKQQTTWEQKREVINEDSYIRNKISDFCHKHNFNNSLKDDFTKNLGAILDIYNIDYINPRLIPQYSQIYETLDYLVYETSKPNTSVVQQTAQNISGEVVANSKIL